MKIVGLITEYNPFHNGHLYHIEKAKEITKADAVIVVMSGNYVQRGAPAIMPKHLRAEVALEAGVDIVLELPVCYATGSAEYFAAGAISLFEQLGCVDSICFGSECGDYGLLERIAHIVADEPEEYKFSLQEALRKGISFPRARQMALKNYLRDDSLDVVLEQPNNILGIEYIKALYKSHSSIRSYTIKRMVSGYHDEHLTGTYSSASAIRKLLDYASHSVHLEGDGMFDEPALSEVLTRLEDQVPPSCIRMLEEMHRSRYPIYANDFSLLLKYKLLTESRDSLVKYKDITDDLANRIMNHANDFITFDQFCDLLKTRDMTYTRISRSLFHILLNITNEDMIRYQEKGYCQYAHILGFRKDAGKLLSHLKKNSQVPLITKLTQIENLNDTGLAMLEKDIFASNLYESIITNKFKMPFVNEYQQQIVRI
ncbi:nucleotidyltransferase [Bariatricus sp. SGI.154]|uniref:nucleotidyltransferase n=1 Tax=Bariatricus sp. SGI.154 TaxID=3420549 RepID=UPI003D060688